MRRTEPILPQRHTIISPMLRHLLNRRFVIGAWVFTVISCAAGDWKPPKDPDPQRIYYSADEDREAKRYEIALQKHTWYFENAVSIERSLSAVRRSFFLSSWIKLGKEYPPAIDKLKEL